jgi:hypothetical protein
VGTKGNRGELNRRDRVGRGQPTESTRRGIAVRLAAPPCCATGFHQSGIARSHLREALTHNSAPSIEKNLSSSLSNPALAIQ